MNVLFDSEEYLHGSEASFLRSLFLPSHVENAAAVFSCYLILFDMPRDGECLTKRCELTCFE